MLIGSNKSLSNSEIHDDIHIYDAEQVTINGCNITGNIIAHESCRRIIIDSCRIVGMIIATGATETSFSNNVLSGGMSPGEGVPDDGLEWAIKQCERTVYDNKKKTRHRIIGGHQ